MRDASPSVRLMVIAGSCLPRDIPTFKAAEIVKRRRIGRKHAARVHVATKIIEEISRG